MSGPILLRPTKPSADEDVVKTLEEMLALAKAGEIVGLLAAGFNGEGQVRWSAGSYSAGAALWALEHMKHILLFG